MKQRGSLDVGLDITRIFAFLCVVSVHFFKNSGYYSFWENNPLMYIEVLMREFFMVCVPLFIIITGYLYIDRDFGLSFASYLKHAMKFSGFFFTWFLCLVAIYIFQIFYMHDTLDLKSFALSLFGYRFYAWYLDMYFGLFLLIPLLNALWKAAAAQESRRLILIVFLIISVVPSLFNSFDFYTPDALLHSSLAETEYPLYPTKWTALYPLTYYYIGGYMREYADVRRLGSVKLGLLTAAAVLLLSTVSCCFERLHLPNEYEGAFTLIKSCLVFLFINSFDYSACPEKTSRLIHYVSRLTLPAYLVSYIPDTALYMKLKEEEYFVLPRLRHFPEVVIKSVIISLLLAAVIDALQSALTALYHRLSAHDTRL